jgi:hypothetical protein
MEPSKHPHRHSRESGNPVRAYAIRPYNNRWIPVHVSCRQLGRNGASQFDSEILTHFAR